jgi:hypothetical protein
LEFAIPNGTEDRNVSVDEDLLEVVFVHITAKVQSYVREKVNFVKMRNDFAPKEAKS